MQGDSPQCFFAALQKMGTVPEVLKQLFNDRKASPIGIGGTPGLRASEPTQKIYVTPSKTISGFSAGFSGKSDRF